MLSRLNKFLYSSIIISILMLIIGFIFMVFPEVSFETITYVLAITLIVNGVYFIVEKENSLLVFNFLTLGIIELLLGIVLLLRPEFMKILFPIVAGMVMIVKSTMDLRISLLLKSCGYDSWLSISVCSIVSIVCGLIIIINPQIGTIALTASLGIMIIIYSISSIIDIFIFKKNINTIVKALEKDLK